MSDPEANGSVDIPIVNLSDENAASQMLQAAVDYGFIFVQHQGLDLTPQHVAEMFELSKEFFAAPQQVKEECSINSASSGKNHGWVAMGVETLDPAHQKRGDFKEAFNLGEYMDGKPQQPLPEPLKSHAKTLGDFQANCHALCDQILQVLATGLEIPVEHGGQDWFKSRHDNSKTPSSSVLRLLHYPALSPSAALDPAVDIRAGAHSDYGSVTLLFRLPGQPGLEILTPDKKWAAVPVNPTNDSGPLPILVNIGDAMAYWTSGLLKSTVHRVIFPKQGQSAADRYSMAYFGHPADDVELGEIPSKLVQKHQQAGSGYVMPDKPLTAGEYLGQRLAATYSVS